MCDALTITATHCLLGPVCVTSQRVRRLQTETGQVDRQQCTGWASAERCDVMGARRQGRNLT